MTQANCHHDFASLPPPVLEALDASGNVFLTRPWFENLVETVIGDREVLRLYTVVDEDRALLLPMMVRRGWLHSCTLAGLQNYYSSLFGAVAHGALERRQTQALVAQLSRGRFHVIDLHPMDRESAFYNELRQELLSAGWWTGSYFCFGNWYLPCHGHPYIEYQQNLPSHLRNTIRRKRRQVGAHNVRIELVTGNDRLEQAIADYVAVFNSSWKKPEPYPRFVPGLIRACAAQGWLRLGLAYVGTTPVAAQIWIVAGGVASIFKLAYSERYAKLSLGTLLTATLMQHVIDVDQVREVDYLTGDEPYKKDWMSHRRERWGIVAFDPGSLRGVLNGLKHFGGRALRRVIGARGSSRTIV